MTQPSNFARELLDRTWDSMRGEKRRDAKTRARFTTARCPVAAAFRTAIRSATVRHFARYFLKARENTADFAPLYRSEVGGREPERLRGAIAGLGEAGTSSDTRIPLPMLEHRLSRVVQVALTALAKLDPLGTRPDIRHLLEQSEPWHEDEDRNTIELILEQGDLPRNWGNFY